MIFMLFFLAFLLYRFFNWAIGIQKFSPGSDLVIIPLIVMIKAFSENPTDPFIIKNSIKDI